MGQIGKKAIVDTHIKGILNYISFFFAILSVQTCKDLCLDTYFCD